MVGFADHRRTKKRVKLVCGLVENGAGSVPDLLTTGNRVKKPGESSPGEPRFRLGFRTSGLGALGSEIRLFRTRLVTGSLACQRRCRMPIRISRGSRASDSQRAVVLRVVLFKLSKQPPRVRLLFISQALWRIKRRYRSPSVSTNDEEKTRSCESCYTENLQQTQPTRQLHSDPSSTISCTADLLTHRALA